MWRRVSRWLGNENSLVKSIEQAISFSVGQTIRFDVTLDISELRGVRAELIRKREYRFDGDSIESYIIKTDAGAQYSFAMLCDDDIFYASISRELSTAERRAWFDPDALSFFLEKTSARTLRCRASSHADNSWAAERYTKTVDLVPAELIDSSKRGGATPFVYSMLMDASGEKAIEIEQYQDHGIVRMYATIFVPLNAIALLNDNYQHNTRQNLDAPDDEPPLFLEPLPASLAANTLSSKVDEDDVDSTAIMGANENTPSAKIIPLHDAFKALSDELKALAEEEVRDFLEENLVSDKEVNSEFPRKEFKNDFRRIEPAKEPPAKALKASSTEDFNNPVPDFLLKPREEKPANEEQLFKKIFEPKASQILCDTESAEIIKSEAARLKQSPQDIIRSMIGLNEDPKPPMAAFELALSEEDYARLAMRYQIRPDKKGEIRKRMAEELAKSIAERTRKKTL